jgi:hypothetical protein
VANLHSGSGSTPIPDPTALTTEALKREISALKELVETRLDAMDKAMELFSGNITRVPTDTDKQIGHLKELVFEKFASVETQFNERDVRSERESKDNKVAVDAALSAQKEAAGAQNQSNAVAIGKSESAFTKQIDQINTLITSSIKALDDKIDDLKERMARSDGGGKGMRDLYGWIVAAVAIGFAALSYFK